MKPVSWSADGGAVDLLERGRGIQNAGSRSHLPAAEVWSPREA